MSQDRVDPFDSTDDTPIEVGAGEFSPEGPETLRLGAWNARMRSRSPWARWTGTSQANRVQWTAALAVLAVVGLLLPALISYIGATQRARLEAAARSGDFTITALLPEVLEVRDSSRNLLGCYSMSSAFAPDGPRDEMKAKLEAVSESVYRNDVALTRRLVDEARVYFVDGYALGLADHVATLMSTWTYASWESDQAVYAAEESLRAHRSLDQIDALCTDVMHLGTALGKVRDEDMASRTTWVPVETPTPTPTPTPEPTQEPPAPAPTQGPVRPSPPPEEEPEPTSEPTPTPTPNG